MLLSSTFLCLFFLQSFSIQSWNKWGSRPPCNPALQLQFLGLRSWLSPLPIARGICMGALLLRSRYSTGGRSPPQPPAATGGVQLTPDSAPSGRITCWTSRPVQEYASECNHLPLYPSPFVALTAPSPQPLHDPSSTPPAALCPLRPSPHPSRSPFIADLGSFGLGWPYLSYPQTSSPSPAASSVANEVNAKVTIPSTETAYVYAFWVAKNVLVFFASAPVCCRPHQSLVSHPKVLTNGTKAPSAVSQQTFLWLWADVHGPRVLFKVSLKRRKGRSAAPFPQAASPSVFWCRSILQASKPAWFA